MTHLTRKAKETGRAERREGAAARRRRGPSTGEHCVLVVRRRRCHHQPGTHLSRRLPRPGRCPRMPYSSATDAMLTAPLRIPGTILHIPIVTSWASTPTRPPHSEHHCYVNRLKDWMRPFKGIACWYLAELSWLAPRHRAVLQKLHAR